MSNIIVASKLIKSDPDSIVSLLQHMTEGNEIITEESVPSQSLLIQSIQDNQPNLIFDSILDETNAYLDTVDHEVAYHYLHKSTESDQLLMKAVAYKCLSELEKEKGNYEIAFEYMDRHLVLKDSIYGVRIQEAEVEINQKYDLEKLATKNMLLSLKKTQIRKFYAVFISIVIFLFLTVSIIYHLNIKRKEKEIIKNKRLAQVYNSKILDNEIAIKENKELLAKKELELAEAKERLIENEKLEAENRQLREMIEKKEQAYNQYVEKTKKEYIEESQELYEKYNRLKRRKEILTEHLIRKNTLLSRLRNASEKDRLSDRELEEMVILINHLYDGFVDRLKEKYPMLTKEEIQYCCFLKIKMKPRQIATVLCISHDTVYKRKQRIKDKIKLKSDLEELLLELEYEE